MVYPLNPPSKYVLPVIASLVLLILLSMAATIYSGIIAIDTDVAVAANSLLGSNATFDKTIGWLNTRHGDALVLSCLCLFFLIHSLKGGSRKEIISRLSFWGCVGGLCLFTYALETGAERFLRRGIPLFALPQLKNVQTMYGITLHTSGASSYPSGHGLAYILFSLMAWRRYLRISLVLWILSVIMISMRLIIGVHWLSDVVLGSLPLSLVVASLAWNSPLKTFLLNETSKIEEQNRTALTAKTYVSGRL
jgi:membrane-associated phospholipid phosphatase